MKRAIEQYDIPGLGRGGLAVLAASLLVAACSGDEATPRAGAGPVAEAEAAGAGSAWIMPPAVTGLTGDGTELVVAGKADPGGRVVLRTPEGRAYAAVADGAGAFEVRLTAVNGMVLTPEAQLGQETVPAPERLLIMDAIRGTAVLLSPGGGSRRLGAAPPLSSVDYDGRAVILSGQAAPDSQVGVEIPGRGLVQIKADAFGRWRIGLDGAVPSEVRVEGRAFAIPALSVDAVSPGSAAISRVERDDGDLLKWHAPDGAPQTSWLPRR